MILKGRVWKFGDNVRSNYFLSGKYDPVGRLGKYSELVQHILEDVDPTFVQKVQRGDVLVAGKAFGTGKHLGGLIGAFKVLGIGGVIAEGFSAAWERDSINTGFPAVVYNEIRHNVETGDLLELDLSATEAKNLTRGITIKVTPTPEGIIAILEAGGLRSYTLHRLGVSAQLAQG